MNRYIGRSLDIDEAMTPKEKVVKEEFLSKENSLRVFGSAQRHVNPTISYSNVVDAMHKEFTQGLGGSAPVSVPSLNQTTIDNLSISYTKHIVAMHQTRRVGFDTSKIPSNMLPRPSFNLQEDDEATGKHQVIFK